MTRQTRAARQDRPHDESSQQAPPADQRNEKLDKEVACCLAEIDQLLEEAESERDAAIREFRELPGADNYGQAERLWRAKYAHLGLRIASGCCTVALYDQEAWRSGRAAVRRTWFQPDSGRPPFRNCSLIRDDKRRPANWLPWRQAALEREWWESFRRGTMSPGEEYNPAEPGPHDRFVPWDDSDEATDRWVKQFIGSNGKDVSG